MKSSYSQNHDQISEFLTYSIYHTEHEIQHNDHDAGKQLLNNLLIGF
jgi:hypothetical protein